MLTQLITTIRQRVLNMSTNKIFILIIGVSFFLWACKTQKVLPSKESKEKLPRVENVHFNKKTETVDVYYDLLAKSSDAKFEIQLLLSLGQDKTYRIDSTSTSGDIGEGILPGKKKKISWNVLDDFPQGIQGKQIQFIVNAQKTNSKNNNKWIYITSGSLILAAGAVLGYLFLKPNGDSGLPLPPARPANN